MEIAARRDSHLPAEAGQQKIPEGRPWTIARQRVMHYLRYLGIEGGDAEALCELTLKMTAWKAPRIGEADVPGAAIRTLENVLAQQPPENASWQWTVWARCNAEAPATAELDSHRPTPAIHRSFMHPEHTVSRPTPGAAVSVAKEPGLLRRLFGKTGSRD